MVSLQGSFGNRNGGTLLVIVMVEHRNHLTQRILVVYDGKIYDSHIILLGTSSWFIAHLIWNRIC